MSCSIPTTNPVTSSFCTLYYYFLILYLLSRSVGQNCSTRSSTSVIECHAQQWCAKYRRLFVFYLGHLQDDGYRFRVTSKINCSNFKKFFFFQSVDSQMLQQIVNIFTFDSYLGLSNNFYSVAYQSGVNRPIDQWPTKKPFCLYEINFTLLKLINQVMMFWILISKNVGVREENNTWWYHFQYIWQKRICFGMKEDKAI